MKNKTLLLGLLATSALMLSACGGNNPQPTDTSEESSVDVSSEDSHEESTGEESTGEESTGEVTGEESTGEVTGEESSGEESTGEVTGDTGEDSGEEEQTAEYTFLPEGGMDEAGAYTRTMPEGTLQFAVSNGWDTEGQFRIYKSQTITFSGAKLRKIVFTCTANGTTKQGPGCFGAGAPEGYTFEADGKVGTWEGEAEELVFTTTDNQVRAVSIVVTYAL